MTSSDAWASAKRILCVRLDALGDVLMTSPALRTLKQFSPDRRLTLMTSPAGAEAASLLPELDDVWVYDAPWVKATAPRADASPDWQQLERLRRERFDAAVIFTVFSQNPLPAALMCFLAGIPLRLAYCRENPYQLLTDWRPDPDRAESVRHEVQRQLDLVESIGCSPDDTSLSIQIPEPAKARALALMRDELDLAAPWIIVHPGATAPSRRYPAELYRAALGQLSRSGEWQFVFTGQADERALISEITRDLDARCVSLAGRLDLGELAAVISMAPLLLCNNTGPAHVAAAVGTPVVDLYALTNPQHMPWQVPSRVLSYDVPCKYCFKSVCPEGHQDCLRKVQPEEVAQAVREIYREAASERSSSLCIR